MPEPASDFLRAIEDRGYLHQCTDMQTLDGLAVNGQVIGYIGFDATADSLHVGSLTMIMMLRLLQRCGHKPIVLMGDGTTKIGDPSFRDDTRPLLDDTQIARNVAGIRKVFDRYLTFGDGPTDALMVNNAEWLDRQMYIPFLRDFGRHFSVNRMLAFDSVKLRLDREQPLSFLEFNYMILQAFDFLELNRRYGCVLQMGGSDQWGNIVNGVELGRRVDGASLYGLTAPLITTSSGAKMGKTAQGAVWLNADKLSPFDYWQYWRNVEDGDVGRFLRLFTDMELDEVRRLEALGGSEINEAKKSLATAATEMCHGPEAAANAADAARQTFEQGTLSTDLPTTDVPRAELEQGIAAFALLARCGLAASNSEGRRLIRGGGARLNDEKIGDEKAVVTLAAANADGVIKLSAGRKRHRLIRPV